MDPYLVGREQPPAPSDQIVENLLLFGAQLVLGDLEDADGFIGHDALSVSRLGVAAREAKPTVPVRQSLVAAGATLVRLKRFHRIRAIAFWIHLLSEFRTG
jgi:hypothetical protein